MIFKESDKVVALVTFLGNLTGQVVLMGRPPVKHQVYVVRGMVQDTVDLNLWGVLLVGIICNAPYGREFAWWEGQFRKLEEIQEENKLRRDREEADALKQATELINSL